VIARFGGGTALSRIFDPEELGALASGVLLVAEVVSPGHDARSRDLVRKRRAYARAGIPAYVIIDELDGSGHVTVLTAPDAKGFVIGVAITGESRTA